MDLHQEVIQYLDEIGIFAAWPQAQEKYESAARNKKGGWNLPARACKAVSGDFNRAIPVVTALGCLQISIVLIDDMLDNDPRGDYHQIGPGLASNMAAALQAAGIEILLDCDLPQMSRLAMAASANRMLRQTAIGQYLDVHNPVSEETYWEMVRMKSSPFYGAAFEIGALAGGATVEMGQEFYHLGALYGEIIQIHDDLGDTLETPASPDWLEGRLPLPILFAQVVDHPERDRFIELRDFVEDEQALREAQEIIVRCGALSYCFEELGTRYVVAQDLFDTLELVYRPGIQELLTGLIDPARNLLEKIGKPGMLDTRLNMS